MTLFEDGDWRLVGGMWETATIMHKCLPHVVNGEVLRNNGTWYYIYLGTCGGCGMEVPDEMMGLQILYNWER